MIDLTDSERETVLRILRTHVPDREVWAYGSRVTGRRRKWSDLDLAVLGPAPLTLRELTRLAWDFEHSDLPFKVDVTDMASVSPEFRARVEAVHERIAGPATRA